MMTTFGDFVKQPVVIQTIILLIGTAVMIFWKTEYRKSKQINQATKEDTGAITKIVEEIKNSLSKETEILKAQLSIANQHKISIKSAERDALIDYNKKLSAFRYYLINFSIHFYNRENYKLLGAVEDELFKRQYEFDISDAHLRLFIHDSEFEKSNKQVQYYTYLWMTETILLIRSFRRNHEEIGDLLKSSYEGRQSQILAIGDKINFEVIEYEKKYNNFNSIIEHHHNWLILFIRKHVRELSTV